MSIRCKDDASFQSAQNQERIRFATVHIARYTEVLAATVRGERSMTQSNRNQAGIRLALVAKPLERWHDDCGELDFQMPPRMIVRMTRCTPFTISIKGKGVSAKVAESQKLVVASGENGELLLMREAAGTQDQQ